jgi:transcriptional regulator with GAF, ATPase, and Fis domain
MLPGNIDIDQSTSLLDRDKLLQSVFRISALLGTTVNLEEILKTILDEVVDAIGFDRGIIRLFDETRRYLETKVVKNYPPEEEERAFQVALDIREHDCISTKVAQSGQPLVFEDATNDPRLTSMDLWLTKIYKHGSIFCAPIKIESDVIGIIAVWCRREMKFYPEEVKLFLAFASQIGIIIHNKRLFEANAEKIRQLMVLQEAVASMNSAYMLEHKVHEALIKSALKISNADRVLACFCIIYRDECILDNGEKIIVNDLKSLGKLLDTYPESALLKKAIEGNQLIIENSNKQTDKTASAFPEYVSQIAIPLKIKDRLKGALYLAKKKGVFSSDEVNILDILVKNAAVAYDNALMHALMSQEANTLKTEVEMLKEREGKLLGFHEILGRSRKMLVLFHIIEEVAKHNTSILIQGESGTGKELSARAIHKQSNRCNKAFIEVNCAAIPGTLLESELFGYEAGAFTDAKKRKIGLIEAASGGTLLLDEIGDMNIHLQAKFLRVLEDGYIRRVGGTENIPVDIRYIFSTNKDLTKMVADGTFREDLFYRISVVPVTIPPLRERSEDIILIASYYVDEFNEKLMKKVKNISKEAEIILKNYAWPGNVRELKNIIERVMILQDVGSTILPENLPAEIKGDMRYITGDINLNALMPHLTVENIKYDKVTDKIITNIKREILDNALQLNMGNKTKAAKQLGISRYKFIREEKKIKYSST